MMGVEDVYSIDEVSKHHTARSVWIAVDGKVYDVTKFMFDHPGGEEIIMQYAGKDVSAVMRDKLEHIHSDSAFEMLQDYQIGILSTANIQPTAKKLNSNVKGDEKVYSVKAKPAELFIDVNKPMLSQVLNSKFSKEYYLEQIHIPRHRSGSAPLFEYKFLEPFSITHWWVIPIVWLPVVVYFLSLGVKEIPVSQVVTLFALGILNWTFLEYTLHRFMFHIDYFLPDHPLALALHFLTHGIHHYLPMDGGRLVMPPALFFMISTPLYWLHAQFLPTYILHSLAAGTYFGYVCYDLMHYYLHHGRPYTEHIREMKTYHLDHHYKEPNLGFGITSKLWDYVFGTLL